MRSQKTFGLVALASFGLMTAALLAPLVLAQTPQTQPTQSVQSGPQPAVPPVLPQPVLEEWVSVNSGSFDTTTNRTHVVLTIKVDYLAQGDENISLEIYDEDTGWEAVQPMAPPAQVNGLGQKTWTYLISKQSNWGKDIMDGKNTQAWVSALMISWVHPPAVTQQAWVGTP